ncbi:MAG: RrF2 family transcriptional regulator [Fidelibacterota bacterium]
MTNFLSKSSQYAIQAVMFLAAQPQNHAVFQRDIARALNIPNHFLGKVLQILVKHDLVISHKGINGGFIINKNAGKVTLNTIVRIIDGDGFLDGCMLGFPYCSDDHPCPIHKEWVSAKNEIINIFQQKDVTMFSDELQSKLEYISNQSRNQE